MISVNLASFAIVLSFVLAPAVAGASSPARLADDCSGWMADQFDLQHKGLNELRQGHYGQAIPPLERASGMLPPCDIVTYAKDRPSLTWVATKQFLIAAYLGNHSFVEAHQVASTLWQFAGKLILQPDQKKASDFVVEGEFKSAFSLYEANRANWTFDPSISDLTSWQSFLNGLSAGAKGEYERAAFDFKRSATPGYKETFYLYGVSLVASGDRCTAYHELKISLLDSYALTSPVDDWVSWASISAIRSIDALYLQNLSDQQVKSILNKC